MELNAELTRFEEDIRRLKVDFDRFLAGALKVPPEERRQELFDHLRQMRSRYIHSYADQFRLNSLEARLNSLNELYNRKMRDFENSGGGGALHRDARDSVDPYAGVVFTGRPFKEGAVALYDELYGSGGGRSKKTDFSSFHDFLQKKARRIRDLTGCSQVRFRVISKKGRLTLKAKPVVLPATATKETPNA